MDEKLLREKIYERLGLELGSLSSEGGNDWIRAEKEVLEEYKQDLIEKASKEEKIDYLSLDKSSDLFKLIMTSEDPKTESEQTIIAERNDLTTDEITQLIRQGSKETILHLIRNNQLQPHHIDMIIPKSVYLVKKALLDTQELSQEQKDLLFKLMNEQKSLYDELLSEYAG